MGQPSKPQANKTTGQESSFHFPHLETLALFVVGPLPAFPYCHFPGVCRGAGPSRVGSGTSGAVAAEEIGRGAYTSAFMSQSQKNRELELGFDFQGNRPLEWGGPLKLRRFGPLECPRQWLRAEERHVASCAVLPAGSRGVLEHDRRDVSAPAGFPQNPPPPKIPPIGRCGAGGGKRHWREAECVPSAAKGKGHVIALLAWPVFKAMQVSFEGLYTLMVVENGLYEIEEMCWTKTSAQHVLPLLWRPDPDLSPRCALKCCCLATSVVSLPGSLSVGL